MDFSPFLADKDREFFIRYCTYPNPLGTSIDRFKEIRDTDGSYPISLSSTVQFTYTFLSNYCLETSNINLGQKYHSDASHFQ